MARPSSVDEPKANYRLSSSAASGPVAIVLALLAVYLIWGSTYLGIRIALEGFPPFLMAGVRFVIAGVGLYLFLRLRGAPNPTRREWVGAFFIGVLLLLGGNGGVTFAEQWVSSSLAAVVVAAMPLWAALFAGLWGRWPNGLEWAGLGLGLLGVILLNLEADLRASPLGAVALLVATISWAFGSIWSKHLAMPSGLMSSAAQMLAGGAALLALSLGTGERMSGPPNDRSLYALAYLIIFGSIVAFSAYLYLLKRVRPSVATSYAYVNPIVALGLGVGFAGEHITQVGLFGTAAILAGVVLVVLRRG